MNDKVIKSIIGIIAFVGGLLLGFYLAVLKYEAHTEIIENKIMEVKDDIHELKHIIQNRVLTKSGE